ncbi:hypothetical protein DVH26_17180 [Paenibacillus sp. H1-7]|nr:hypothetical protein DVH26_17180 [Paenibacillus sp. H1-7]
MKYTLFWMSLVTVWVALIGFGYEYLTQYWYNGPIYFLALTASILPVYIVLYRSFKHYMEAGWLNKIHMIWFFIMIAFTVVLFKWVVIPLSDIDID